jgi:hypothetical protein
MERVRLKRRLEVELQHLPRGRLKRQELLTILASEGIISKMPATRLLDQRGDRLYKDRWGDYSGWIQIPGQGRYWLGADIFGPPESPRVKLKRRREDRLALLALAGDQPGTREFQCLLRQGKWADLAEYLASDAEIEGGKK